MKHANIKGGILAVRASAADPTKVLNDMTTAFSQFKQDQQGQTRELQTGLDEVNQTLAGLRVGGFGPASGGVSERDKTQVNSALRKLIRDGDDSAMASLQSSVHAGMSTDSNPDGGYLTIPFLSPVLQEKLLAVSPMRQLARVEKINSDTFEEITSIGSTGAAWVAETEARVDTASPPLHKVSVPVSEISAMPKVTQRLLDDDQFDLAGWLAGNIARSFAALEGAAFVNGDGIGKPKGVLAYPVSDADDATRPWATIQTVPSGAASTIDEDSLVSIAYSARPEYRGNASWLMNRQTAAVIRKLKDSQGRFLWTENFVAGQPPTILGAPVFLDEQMPDIGAGTTPLLFGDFASGYLIVDRTGLRLLRDPYTDKPNVRFYTTKRVGGAVFNTEAVKILRVGT